MCVSFIAAVMSVEVTVSNLSYFLYLLLVFGSIQYQIVPLLLSYDWLIDE